MRPDRETTNAFLYCLAVAAKRSGVGVMFFAAMSNHYHAGVVDKAGRLPEFLEYFHKLFAKHQNVLRGRWENFWAPEQTSVVELVGAQDVLDKMVYTLTNPVNAHLVARAEQWPGASSLSSQLTGRAIHVSRPGRFFRADGPMPDAAVLELQPPPGFEAFEADEYVALVRERISTAEQTAAAYRVRRRISVMGAAAVQRQRWSDRPSSVEPRRGLCPRVASKNFWRRAETLARNRAFTEAYRVARELLLAGKAATFPAGTYWLRRFAGASCEPPPPPA